MGKIGLVITFVLFFLSVPFINLAQDSDLEKAFKAYRQEKSDSLRIEDHFHIINLLLTEPKNHLEAAEELKQLKKESASFPVYLGNARIKMYEGRLEYIRGEYINSIISFKQAIREFESAERKEFAWIGNCYGWLGLSYSMVNDWENAQMNYQQSIGYLEQIADSSAISHTYLNTAYIFFDIEDWHNAIITLNKSLNYLTPAGERETIASIYASLSTCYSKEGKLPEAKHFLDVADSVIKLQSRDVSNTFYYLAEGEYFLRTNEWDRSLLSHERALKHARSWGDSAFVANILENLGVLFMRKKNIPQAMYYLEESIRISEKNNFLPQKVKSLKRLFQLYKVSGLSKEAVGVADQLFKMNDSFALVLNSNRRIVMDASFENERKEKRISALEGEREIQLLKIRQKNTLNYILISGAAITLLLLFLSYRNYQQHKEIQQQRINELEREKKLTATEAVFKGEEQERTRMAKDLHDGLGGLLSGIKYALTSMKGNFLMTPENNQALERSMDMLDSSIKEMRRVAHNMMPEALVKFGLDTALKDFCNDINQIAVLKVTYQSIILANAPPDQTTSIAIYRIVQELVHNSMKHAAARTAIVQLSITDGKISITVEDDGKGFDTSILKHSKGIGWSNIQSRVDFLNGKMDVQSGPGKGTSVHIELNNVT